MIDLSFLARLGIARENPGGYAGRWLTAGAATLAVRTPITGQEIARIAPAGAAEYEQISTQAQQAFLRWRSVPAPVRGELVRQFGQRLREQKADLGRLVTLETGKLLVEGLGEIQECIDVADYAVGLSRQLFGLTIKSERPQHSMRETWHPLGTVGVITAFNFPAAVWAWNATIALVCGDALLWKPSPKVPLTAIALTRILAELLEPQGLGGLAGLVIGADDVVGSALLDDRRIPLVSATGSTRLGRIVAERVGRRLGRTLLELGGNNAVVVLDDADLGMAVRSILFGAVGTAGQRCTSTRRVLVQHGIAPELERRLLAAYRQVRIGNPFDPDVLMGPVLDAGSVTAMQRALAVAREQGGTLLCGGDRVQLDGALAGGQFVTPAIVRCPGPIRITHEETFAPVLYVIPVAGLDEAIAIHNDVPQGLSSAIFTGSVRHAERFLSEVGSDCGIANVNLGTSGAEIGGAFGGEKETGGGRESGSDSWKAYMRRQTSTVNWGTELPLAQGITFGV